MPVRTLSARHEALTIPPPGWTIGSDRERVNSPRFNPRGNIPRQSQGVSVTLVNGVGGRLECPHADSVPGRNRGVDLVEVAGLDLVGLLEHRRQANRTAPTSAPTASE